jgi:kanamycin kinase
VRARFDDWEAEIAYSYIPELATWRLTRGSEVRFVKLAIEGWTPSFEDERARLAWAAAYLPVPHVLDGGIVDGVQWTLLTGLPGKDATARELRRDPATLVANLGAALRAFHDAAPAQACPFNCTLDVALDLARRRVDAGLVDPETDFHDEHRRFTPATALEHLEANRPPDEDVVVTHGDYCPPNILFDDDGGLTGFVDLGELGVADRWRDVAVGTWSVTWNYGPGWEPTFLEAYGIEPDPDRIAYYRLLYDLVS